MSEKEEIISYIKRAFELREQKCYKQAIEMLYKAIVIEPDNTEILYQIGELYYLLENYARAIQYPEQILKIEEMHIPSMKLIKNIYIKQNELCSAKEVAEKIYNSEPNEQNLVSLIGIYGRLSLFDEIEKYSDIIEKSEKCLTEYAKICYNSQMPDKAKDIIQKGLRLNPENIELKILTGKICFDNSEFEKAKEIFSEFDKYEENTDILNYRGLFALEEEDFISAIKYFSKAMNLSPENACYAYNLGNAYFLNGWYEEAVQTYKKALYLEPDNLDYRYSLAYSYYSHEDYEKAKLEVDYILDTDRNYSGARVLKALMLFKQKNYLEAEKILNSVISGENPDDFALSALAKVEQEIGKFDKAKEHLLILVNKYPDNLIYNSDLSGVYIKLKDYAKALDIAKKIISADNNCVEGYLIGARAEYAAGSYEEAKSYAQEVLSVDINCAEGYYYLALVRKQENDYEEAIECLRRAIIYDVNNAEYYAEMASVYELYGDNKSAFEYIKEAENIDKSEEYKILYKKYASLNRK